MIFYLKYYLIPKTITINFGLGAYAANKDKYRDANKLLYFFIKYTQKKFRGNKKDYKNEYNHLLCNLNYYNRMILNKVN